MKKFITILITLMLLLNTAATSWATPLGFSGGANNEYEYEEIVFLTGKPIKFVGEFDVSERDREDEKKVTYRFELKPQDRSIEAELERRITVITRYTKRNDKGQTIAQTYVDSYKETLKIGEDEYELVDFQFSKSDIIDNRPASDFYSGNIKGRKYYTINGEEGKIIVDITGGDVGYKNFWGSTETQIIDYFITSERFVPEDPEDEENTELKRVSWQGTVKVQVSDSMTKNVKYFPNTADSSSFRGGYMKITNREIVSVYDYNLPEIDEDGKVSNKKRNKGVIHLSKKMVPKLERLIIPKFKDLGGHWAEGHVEKLYSLEIFDETSRFFTPNIPMSRLEFTRAVMKACNLRISMDDEQNNRRRRWRNRMEPATQLPFKDINPESEDYKYIEEAYKKGLVAGVTEDLFKPSTPLTRAQAVTILIRALGFDNRAPNPGYYTAFADDDRIPYWAKDCIYVAREIGLILGDNYNRVNPNKIMTRAEAAAMLVRFLEFLEADLQRDYRENIILFN